MGNKFTLLGVSAAVCALFRPDSSFVQWGLGLVALVLAAVLLVWWSYLIRRLAIQLAEIEAKVNNLAGEVLLSWESTHHQRPMAKGMDVLAAFAADTRQRFVESGIAMKNRVSRIGKGRQ